MDMKNAIVAAYVHAYEAGMINSREEMLEKLVIELTKRLERVEQQEAINVVQLSQPHWFGDSQIFYKEDVEDALKLAGVKFKVREL